MKRKDAKKKGASTRIKDGGRDPENLGGPSSFSDLSDFASLRLVLISRFLSKAGIGWHQFG
jgi:hypothetical protein